MPNYLSPGVYVEEVSSGSKPIAGVGTSTGAFVGIARKGTIGKAVLITNWSQFVKEFGNFLSDRYLAYAVYGFFAEGGTSCYVVRTCHYSDITDANSKTAVSAKSFIRATDYNSTNKHYSMQITASSEGLWGNNLLIMVETGTDGVGFKLTVYQNSVQDENKLESFDQLTMPTVEDSVNYSSKYIRVATTWGTDPNHVFNLNPPYNPQTSTNVIPLSGGDDGVSSSVISANSFIQAADYDATNKHYSMKINALNQGTLGNNLFIMVEDGTGGVGFKLTVYQNSVQVGNKLESFDLLTMDTVEDTVNYYSRYIRVATTWGTDANHVSTTPPSAPKTSSATTDAIPLTGGDDGNSSLAVSDFYGDEAGQTGLHAFDVIDGINIVAIPDGPSPTVTLTEDSIYQTIISQGLMYCKNRQDCFFIADPPPAKAAATDMKTYKKNFNSSYGAMYFPWVYISDPLNGGQKKLVPPSGVVAGTYAYTDANRGVHKAPAGITDGYLDSVNGLAEIVTKPEQELLNPVGVNVIRSLPAGICIWGARTLSVDSEWTYVNVRRLLIYIERSLYKGTQWVVFEPNDANLWANVKRNITAFLTKVWRDGALFGSTPDEAFFVKVDAENNPPELRDLGQLVVDVGVAPVKPAEFVIIRISQKRSQ